MMALAGNCGAITPLHEHEYRYNDTIRVVAARTVRHAKGSDYSGTAGTFADST